MTINEIAEEIKEIKTLLYHLQSTPIKTHLKTKEACEFLSVSPNTLKNICAENNIPPKQIDGSGSNYYRVKDLENLFTQGREN